MSNGNILKKDDEPALEPTDKESILLRIAMNKATSEPPIMLGSSYFYEIPAGWQTETLKKDTYVHVINNVRELEEAFFDINVRTVFITRSASITKNIAKRICQRHGQGKTVFFEVENHE